MQRLRFPAWSTNPPRSRMQLHLHVTETFQEETHLQSTSSFQQQNANYAVEIPTPRNPARLQRHAHLENVGALALEISPSLKGRSTSSPLKVDFNLSATPVELVSDLNK